MLWWELFLLLMLLYWVESDPLLILLVSSWLQLRRHLHVLLCLLCHLVHLLVLRELPWAALRLFFVLLLVVVVGDDGSDKKIVALE
jgi:hypothetical protein